MMRNAYTCDVCDGHIVTVDCDAGVTPFSLPCYATPSCRGIMTSHFYSGPIVNSARHVTHEFRSPTELEYEQLTHAARQHVDAGGLELYEVGRDEDE